MIVLSYSHIKCHPLLFRDYYTTLKYFNTWTDTIHHYTSRTYIVSLLVSVLSWLYICNSYNSDFNYKFLHESVVDYTQQIDDGLDVEEINHINVPATVVTLLVSVSMSVGSYHLGFDIVDIMKHGGLAVLVVKVYYWYTHIPGAKTAVSKPSIPRGNKLTELEFSRMSSKCIPIYSREAKYKRELWFSGFEEVVENFASCPEGKPQGRSALAKQIKKDNIAIIKKVRSVVLVLDNELYAF